MKSYFSKRGYRTRTRWAGARNMLLGLVLSLAVFTGASSFAYQITSLEYIQATAKIKATLSFHGGLRHHEFMWYISKCNNDEVPSAISIWLDDHTGWDDTGDRLFEGFETLSPSLQPTLEGCHTQTVKVYVRAGQSRRALELVRE